MTQNHIPVLLDATVQLLDPKPGETYMDATAGYGGHAEAIAKRIGPRGGLILVDRDAVAIRHLNQMFHDSARIIHADYLEAASIVANAGVWVDMILLDLGVSSPQLDKTERGFSFRSNAPLDMRMDQSQSLTAADVVNHYGQSELERIIRDYGEEHRARAVAKAIVAARPLTTTVELANVIRRVVGRSDTIDGATRTFQAIRIEVNAELSQLATVLPKLERLLVPGGRLAVITFHSLEDRIVKQFIDTESRDCICPPKQPICTCDHVATLEKVTSKPIAGLTQDAINPRARSAKLRVARKLTPKQPKGE